MFVLDVATQIGEPLLELSPLNLSPDIWPDSLSRDDQRHIPI